MGNVYIGEETEIEAGSIIQGPVYIGKNCKLMYHSYIRPGTVLGDNCVIGFSTEIKHTIMRDGSKVSDLAFVGDSIIGKNSRIGSGVIVANRGFNQEEIIIKDENKVPINLKREVMGLILGDNSRIGSNCTTSPGTFVGKYTWVYPHTCIHGFIPEQKKVYDKQNIIFTENEKKVLNKSTDWNYGDYK
jgi:bifunctional UDP-N-acetylglucosamine pyrophosphorylase/glucosamine-1-phosphate N-acetyltransferase